MAEMMFIWVSSYLLQLCWARGRGLIATNSPGVGILVCPKPAERHHEWHFSWQASLGRLLNTGKRQTPDCNALISSILEAGKWVTERLEALSRSCRKAVVWEANVCWINKCFGEAHPADGETETRRPEGFCQTMWMLTFIQGIKTSDFVACHLL